MGQATAIEWAHHTRNPWRGCAKVDSGCTNCYAEVDMSVMLHGIKWGTEQQGGSRVVLAEAGWAELLKWNRRAEAAGERRRVFCASLADIFEDWRGPMLNHRGSHLIGITMRMIRCKLFTYIDQCPWLDFLLLTKRPDRIREEWPPVGIRSQQQADDRNERGELFRRNVWLGASVSNDDTSRKLDALIGCRDLAPVLWCSAEPLIGPLEFRLGGYGLGEWIGREWRGLDWVVVGGESGHHARICDVAWIEAIVGQCRSAGVPVFVKQIGSRAVAWHPAADGLGGITGGGGNLPWPTNHPKGGDREEWPAGLRIQEFPEPSRLMEAWRLSHRP